MITPAERALLDRAIARMRSRIIAVVCAVVGGAGLFFATVMHIPRAVQRSTFDISLLGNYLPGYEVSWPGAFLGLAYGALLGVILGGALAWCYNRSIALAR